MRKISIFLFALATAMLSGCSKDNESNNQDVLTFVASIDDVSFKTTLVGGTKVCWKAGDEISINGIVFTAALDASDATKAVFTKKNVSDPNPASPFEACYPATLNTGTGYILPAAQAYAAGGDLAGVSPMYASGTATSLSFKNVCALFAVTAKGKDKITCIEVSDGNKGMSGSCTIEDNTAVVSGNAPVKLDCGEGVSLTGDGVVFYIAVPAGEYASLKVKFTDDKGSVCEIPAKKTITVNRNTVYPFTLAPSFGNSVPEGAINGVFSLSATKRVYFAKGNLYYDGSFNFESNQWDTTPYSMPPFEDFDHVSHFFWAGSVDAAVAEEYDDEGSASDVFFANSLNISGNEWTVPVGNDWIYLLNARVVNGDRGEGSSYNFVELENGWSGILVYPDDYSKQTGEETSIPEGCLFLPYAGTRESSAGPVDFNDGYGAYWLGSTSADDMAEALILDSGEASVMDNDRFFGSSVRMVYVIK